MSPGIYQSGMQGDAAREQAEKALGKARVLHSNSQVELVGDTPYYSIQVLNETGKHDTRFDAIEGVPVYYGRKPA